MHVKESGISGLAALPAPEQLMALVDLAYPAERGDRTDDAAYRGVRPSDFRPC